ncbi:amino acid adenylation domain-containing protein [Flavitalea sp. BT771]|uniref:non-ribosomal peptide synthetase n=1 Tax=Flavitalea sp. BT771 TaxID=3063329 RepID=UPI0026E132DE|nr:non-ribosomal peptide synthetase [Flavitalea sp. BT771]MDO6434613.1 amino acid adenylation domain-containing protein [Flavitalea sp. BT771]MDV6223513.1 amino acid adenylation domain-containing protein [Flavitalea sp. BT771]
MQQLLRQLKDNNIIVSLDKEKHDLRVRFNGASLPDDILTALKENKAGLIEYLARMHGRQADAAILPLEPQPFYTLSSAQRRFWILSQTDEGNVAYNMTEAYVFEGQLDRTSLSRAFDSLLARHESLRTVFRQITQGEPRQFILPPGKTGFQIAYTDLSQETEKNAMVDRLVKTAFARPLDLTEGPLLRAELYQLSAAKWVFTCVMHHIISDGWSMNILIDELMAFYKAHHDGERLELPALRIQYKDYAAWQQERLNGDALKDDKAYWMRRFRDDLPEFLPLGDRSRPTVKTYDGDILSRHINPNTTRKLRSLSNECGSTLFMGLLASVNALLYRYTGRQDLVVGSPIAGREQIDLESMIGPFINTLALRVRCDRDDSFQQLLDKVRQVTLEAYEHQEFPFDEIVNSLNLRPDPSRNPLFDVMVILQNTGMKAPAQDDGQGELTVTGYKGSGHFISKLDLTLNFIEKDDGIQIGFEYNTHIFTREAMQQLASHYLQLLEKLLQEPGVPVRKLDYLDAAEKNTLLSAFNNTDAPYPAGKSVLHLIKDQVALTPHATAVVFEGHSLSYEQLYEKAARLGAYLRKKFSLKAGDLVAISLERSEWQVISLLSTWMAGAAYIPIDPGYPGERIDYMLSDSGCKAVIDQDELDAFSAGANRDNDTDILSMPVASGPAYVIYTSGSTGLPKGCIITHQNLSNYIHWANQYYFNGEGKGNFGLFTSLSFDLTVTSIFCSLTRGNILTILPHREDVRETLLACFNGTTAIDSVKLTPSHINLLRYIDADNSPISLVIAGGEQVMPEHIRILKSINPAMEIYNEYGPTETTVGCIVKQLEEGMPVLIGRPIANTRIYILDQDRALCPTRVTGEIYIGGDGVSAGYLERPELTADRFVDDPFHGNSRLYRTGDLGRWLGYGDIEFIGRADDQVKISGHRIEPAEIESVLMDHVQIDATAVLAKTDGNGDRHLVAYFVSWDKPDPAELRAYLASKLPAFMIPTHFMQLETIPLTVNGKVDRNKLPDPEGGLQTARTYVAPRTRTETRLVRIWEEIFNTTNVGIKDSFLDLGGYSLKIIRLASQIHKEFEVKPSLKELFANITVEEQAVMIDQARITSFVNIPKTEEMKDYPLSSAQRRLWVLSQFEKGNVAYIIPGICQFQGDLNIAALTNAFDKLLERHESLRTAFRNDDQEGARQFILPPEDLGFRIVHQDLRNEKDQQEVLQRLIQSEFNTPFDLAAAPLVRASLYQMEDHKWIFTYVVHHIISDAWSMSILIKELLLLYNAAVQGREHPLLPIKVQYKDYAAWQQQQLQDGSLLSHREYWLKQLDGELPILQLPTDKARRPVNRYKGGKVSRMIAKPVTEAINRLSQEQGGTLFMGLLAAVNTYLYRYTGQQDIIIGSPISGRDHLDLEDQIGLYINTLALRTRFSGKDTYQEVLKNAMYVTLEAYDHKAYPFDQLLEDLHLQRDISRSPLFNVLVDFHSSRTDTLTAGQELHGLQANDYPMGEQTVSKFDLTFYFVEYEQGVNLALEYNGDLYTKETAERLFDHFEGLLGAIVESPSVPISSLEYMYAAEKGRLLETLNTTPPNFEQYLAPISLFEQQAALHPDEIALVLENSTMSYGTLNELSGRLAAYLKVNGQAGADELIGVQLDRSEWMIIALLGIWKSGAAYVPIDPGYPRARKEYLINDTGIKTLITQTDYIFDMEYFKGDVFAIDSQLEVTDLPALPTAVASRPTDLAYVIYTSGSTGTPKGCAITNDNLSGYVQWANNYYFKNEKPHFGLYTSLSFDLTVTSIFCPLTKGGRLTIFHQRKDISDILQHSFHADSGIDSIKITPSHVNILKYLDIRSATMRRAIIGGEAVSSEHLRILKTIHPGIEVYDEYGPTETTVGCTVKLLEENEPVVIGKPISRTRIYILDEENMLCPTGVAGEICVGGAGVARGYLHQPSLTAEKFTADPFMPGERIYRTGDLGRWLGDGNIEFIGRKDAQVKIRGYRIELGEVENALQSHEHVDAAVVAVRSDGHGDKLLVAYLVSPRPLDAPALRSYLSKIVPAYMVPGHYIQLDQLPLTENGKVDRAALPEPADQEMETLTAHVDPRNVLERELIEVFEEVLKRHPIDMKDDFFVLGGDSIKSIQIVARLRQKGYIVTIQDIMLYPVVEDLAPLVKLASNEIDQFTVEGFIPLSPIQSYFFEHYTANRHHFNQSVLLRTQEDISEESLRAVLDKIVFHHDALRMVFWETPDGWMQENKGDEQGYSLEVIDYLDAAQVTEHCERIQAGFDLENGPLFKAALFRGDGEHRLLLVAHHLIMDGVSWRILLEDLSTLYRQYRDGHAMLLPPKTHSFSFWQENQVRYASSTELANEEPYWQAVEAQQVPPLVPERPEGTNLVKNAASATFALDKTTTNKLLTQCYKAYRTEINDILLTALSLALSEVLSAKKVVIGMEGHGREAIGANIDISRTIGWFTTLHPLVLDLEHTGDVIHQLINVKEKVHRVPNKGIGYGILRYLAQKEYRRTPDIIFNYLGDFGSGARSEGEKPLFQFTSEYRGREMSAEMPRIFPLRLSGFIAEGFLQLSLEYSDQQYSRTTIDTLLDACKRHLTRLIDILSSEEKTHVTPVDLTYKELSSEQLKELNKML